MPEKSSDVDLIKDLIKRHGTKNLIAKVKKIARTHAGKPSRKRQMVIELLLDQQSYFYVKFGQGVEFNKYQHRKEAIEILIAKGFNVGQSDGTDKSISIKTIRDACTMFRLLYYDRNIAKFMEMDGQEKWRETLEHLVEKIDLLKKIRIQREFLDHFQGTKSTSELEELDRFIAYWQDLASRFPST